MAYNVSNNYKQIIYSGDARNKLKLLFNNVELQDADRYCEKMTVKSRIVPNGAKIFSLNNFISKEVELILHDIDTSIIQDQVSISIGTLVGNAYEYVPIGIFNIENQPTNDKNKTTIKLRDNSVKFDFNYNAQPLIEENGGSATKLQILQDICTQAGVTCNITSFIGYLDEIGIYDNTIAARQYVANIAEQAGKIATINRSGELIFIDLNNLTTWEIPIEIVEKYENGTKYKIGRVVYEDGIVRYETPTSNDDTLFLDGSNNYINGELTKEQASSSDNSYYLENTSDSELSSFELEGKTTQETRSGKNLLNNTLATQTINGLTLTKNSDGTFTINGTANNLTIIGISTTENIQSIVGLNKRVILSGITTSGNYELRWTESNSVYTDSGNGVEFLPSSNSVGVYLIIRNGASFSNVVVKPMVRLATITEASYEPYGISPSPEFPSELVSVGYENVFDINTSYLASSVANFNIDGDTITFTVTQATTSGAIFYRTRIDDTLLENGKAYTLSCVNGAGANGTLYLQLRNRDGSYAQKNGAKTVVYDSNYGLFVIGNIFSNTGSTQLSVGDTATVSKIQVEKGNETHSYIPYGKYGIEVKTTGKNLLLNTLNNTATYYGITFTPIYNSNGLLEYINVNGTATSNTSISVNSKLYIDKSTSYTLSGCPSGGTVSTYRFVCYLYDKNGTYLSGASDLGNGATFNNSNVEYVNLLIYIASGTTCNNLKFYPMLEKNTRATTYEPYKSNTHLYTLDKPLRSIGDIKDLLYIKNGMLYVDRKIGNVILNGTQDVYLNGTTTNNNNFHIFVNNAKSISNSSIETWVLSNYFLGSQTSTTVNSSTPNLIALISNSRIYIVCKKSDFADVNAFKTWLSTHNTEVQYVLNEPYTEELGSVDMPSTYEGITYLDISSNINTNTYLQYRQNKTQLEAILDEVNELDIDSLKTGKILGNPAIDPYDLIKIVDGNKTYTTLATNDLVYTGVLINTFDTQIGEEAKEQNVTINGEATFRKWAKTSIDNVEGSINLQAGKIDEANGRINTTDLTLDSQGALLNVIANNSNIDVEYDSDGNPLSGEIREVTTTTGFTFNADGMTIADTQSNFKALHRNTGTYYYDGNTITGQYTKDGSKQKDLQLFGVYYYGMRDKDDTPMFVAQLYTDNNGEEAFGHFYNRGDN